MSTDKDGKFFIFIESNISVEVSRRWSAIEVDDIDMTMRKLRQLHNSFSCHSESYFFGKDKEMYLIIMCHPYHCPLMRFICMP